MSFYTPETLERLELTMLSDLSWNLSNTVIEFKRMRQYLITSSIYPGRPLQAPTITVNRGDTFGALVGKQLRCVDSVADPNHTPSIRHSIALPASIIALHPYIQSR